MSWFRKNRYPAHLEDELPFGKQVFIFLWETFKIVVISLAIIIPVRHFIIKPFYVKGASMEPTFHDHEYLIINEISYHFGDPGRGDTIVFKYPFDPTQYFIKRVIGLPGETIKIANDQVVIYNNANPQGLNLDESYLASTQKTLGDLEVKLGADEYFLMGDNRLASLDSRAFGPVKRSYIVGQTLFRGWPLNRVGLVAPKIEYNK
ncbi:MAG: signal peptidase I [Patescibacteria group bacterium]|nr:signal peptidase I [Patescibacteria group bacterium]